MGAAQPTAKEASRLKGATMAVSMIGIFLCIFFLFVNTDLTVRIAAATLVGVVGFLSFLRHSVYYASDQAGGRITRSSSWRSGMRTLRSASGHSLQQPSAGDLSAV
jgi:hypothetical protein